jgi:hypothetical protein
VHLAENPTAENTVTAHRVRCAAVKVARVYSCRPARIVEDVGLVYDLSGVVVQQVWSPAGAEVLLAPEVEIPRGKVYCPQNPQAFAAFARTALSLRSSGVSAASALLRARSYRR